MKPTLRSYSDDGHGWVAVKRKRLVELGILEKITSYSYQRGQTVYLEEDCDATTYFMAENCPTYVSTTVKFNVIHKNTNGRSPIRSYDRFTLEV